MAFDLTEFNRTVLNDPLVRDIWNDKYRWREADGSYREDSVVETRRRVVRAVYADDPNSDETASALRAVENGFFIPAGRINAGAGLDRAVTLTNCFVNEIVQDSMPGIQRATSLAAFTMQQGGGVGTDWSTVRPSGAIVRRTGSVSSGVIPFMDQMNAMCGTVTSAGTRRGAMMGTLRDDHPDLWNEDQFETTTAFSGTTKLRSPSFISAKRLPNGSNPQRDRLDQFNVSVLVSDAFMRAVQEDLNWDLGFHVPRADGNHVAVYDRPFPYDEIDWDNEGRSVPGKHKAGEWAPWYVYRRVPARRIWEDLMRGTYVYAEPGVIYIDQINERNNLRYCEDIRCTNPCGEQPLPPHGTCCLGSVNVAFMVRHPFTDDAYLDFELFAESTRVGVRFLDNVLSATRFPLEAQQRESDSKRRIGLGVTGWADALAQLGVRYGSDDAVGLSREVSKRLAHHSYVTSAMLAKERGAFPLYDARLFDSPNVKRLLRYAQELIKECGLRNGVLNTEAPNGTISMYIGNVSSGIEPIFSTAVATRKVRQPDGSFEEYESLNYAVRLFRAMRPGERLPDYFVGAHQVSPLDHVRMQAAFQENIDASISKTVNCPMDLSFEDFRDVYQQAYELGCKGCTTYRPDPTAGRGSILSEGAAEAVQDAPKADGNPRLTWTPTGDPRWTWTPTGEEIKTALDLLARGIKAETAQGLVRPRPNVVEGRTHKLKWPPTGETIYVTVNHVAGRPFEVFLRHADPTLTEWTDALGRMLTGVFRREGDVRFVAEQLQQVGSTKGGAFLHGKYWPSQVAAIGGVLAREILAIDQEDAQSTAKELPDLPEPPIPDVHPDSGACPKCHQHTLANEEGCLRCLTCGHSACG